MYKNVHHITAGAGAGKTTELVNIITRLIKENGAEPQRMILSTYTDAAATELREKSKANLTPDEAVRMNGALMGTLHSIASRYIKRYWYLLGISPSVKPVPDSMSAILMDRSMIGIVTGKQKALLNKYVETFGLIDIAVGGYDYDFWKETLKKLFDKMRGYGFGKDKLPSFREKSLSLLESTFETKQNEVILNAQRPVLEEYLLYKDIVNDNATESKRTAYNKKHAVVREILNTKPGCFNAKKLKEYAELATETRWTKCPVFPNANINSIRYNPLLMDSHVKTRDAVAELTRHLIPLESSLIVDVTELLFTIMADWMDAYDKVKRESGVIDYADMEELFLRLLGKKEVLDDIHASVDYLFVDEFQDSTPIQAKIYEILSNQIKQSWFVGDRKQAIYGFAGSDSSLIADLVKAFPKEEKDELSITKRKKDANGNSSQILGTSRRSTPKLVYAANEIFIKAFEETTGNVKDVIPEEHVRLESDPKKKDTPWDPLYHVLVEDADALATFVCQMAESQPFKDAGYTFSDIAILTRKGSQAKKIGKALIKKQIPTGYVDPSGFMDTPEVSLVLAILRLSEGMDLAKSRAEIRKLVHGESLEMLTRRVGNQENNLIEFPRLETFAKALRLHSVADRVHEIITRLDLNGLCGQWGNPDARRGCLDLLRKAAKEYTDKSAFLCTEADVRGFLSFLNDFKTDQKFDNSADGVKVLTYHKSKGLDWKIVILYGLDEYKEENNIGGVSVLGPSMDPESILVIPRLPDKDWVRNSILANEESRHALEERRAQKQGEEKRLLYVGFTRAKEVVITAAVDTDPKVLRVLCPTVRERKDEDKVLDGDKVNIWGIPDLVSRCKAFDDDPDLAVSDLSTPERYKEAGILLATEQAEGGKKYHSPSKYRDESIQAAATVEVEKDFHVRIDIPHDHLDNNVFGDCIHHIFARCVPGRHEANLAVAESTLKGYGIQEANAPGKAVSAIERLFDWLSGKEDFGQNTGLEQEVPFQYTDSIGRVFSGDMDLVWHTTKGCVVVDFKTTSGETSELFDKGNEHWAGNYASQLNIYADALVAREEKSPLDRLLYYPEEGLVIRLK